MAATATKTKGTKSSTKKYGKIEIEAFADPQDEDFVPQTELFIDEHGAAEELAWAFQNNEDVLIEGPTGTGKTSLVRSVCADLNRAYRRIPCQEATDTAALIGKPWLWNDRGVDGEEGTGQQEMIFQRGPVYEAVYAGHVLNLDEANFMHPDVAGALHSLYQCDEKMLVVMENEGEVVPRHEHFRLVATANPTTYAGTKVWNPATRSRYGVVIQMKYLSPEEELKIIQDSVPGFDAKLAEAMVNAAKLVRDTCADERIRFSATPRELKTWARLVHDGFTVERAAFAALLNKCDESDIGPVEELVKQAFTPEAWRS